MNCRNGFSLIEVMIAMSIVMMLVATVLPIRNLISIEQYLLKSRHTIQLVLHDQLLEVLYNDAAMSGRQMDIHSNKVTITFQMEGELIKGCAVWQNTKSLEEVTCLYGIKEE